MAPPDQVQADRLHHALSATFEELHSAIPGASFERRTGHAVMVMPGLPIRLFNGVLVESEPCVGIAESIRDVELRGVPCGVQIRGDGFQRIEAELDVLGLAQRDPMPGMAVEPGRLAATDVPGLEIERVEDDRGLRDAAEIVAETFGAPLPAIQYLYCPALIEIDGLSLYLGCADGTAVTTGIGFQTDDDGGIFSVATGAEHRRRGYGGAVSARAARDLFTRGADLVWLQASPLGEPVYRNLGFRHVVTHFMLARPG